MNTVHRRLMHADAALSAFARGAAVSGSAPWRLLPATPWNLPALVINVVCTYATPACPRRYTSASDFNHHYGQRGQLQHWVVPKDMVVEFKVYGASGTMCTWVQKRSKMGQGGLAQGKMNVKKGDQFYFVVGQKGRPGTNRPGGWGGGGRSWSVNGPGGSSGSGGSHVFWRSKGDSRATRPNSNSNVSALPFNLAAAFCLSHHPPAARKTTRGCQR